MLVWRHSVAATHFTDFISVFVDVLSVDDRVITAAVYIAEAGHIYLTGGVRASRSRLGFRRLGGGLLVQLLSVSSASRVP